MTFTHEVLEALADPWINLAAQTGAGQFYAVEVGDPVESDRFAYLIGAVKVSDFVLPAWFIPGHPGPYDCLGSRAADGLGGVSPVSAPLELASGGYASVWSGAGGWSQVSAADRVSTPDPGDPRNRFSRRT